MTRPCPHEICDGSGFVENRDVWPIVVADCRCRPQIVAAARARTLTSTIPRKYRNLRFERAPITYINDQVVAHVRAYVESITTRLEEGDGLWLHGPAGTGKTSLAMLVSQAATAAGRTVAVYSAPRLLSEIRSTYDDNNDRSYIDLMDRLCTVDLLHLDDLGAEKTSPWVLEQFYTIINARYEEQRSVIVTTNLDRAALADQVEYRVVSRLQEMCEDLLVGGDDMRSARRSGLTQPQ